jgi:hypothetical protein
METPRRSNVLGNFARTLSARRGYTHRTNDDGMCVWPMPRHMQEQQTRAPASGHSGFIDACSATTHGPSNTAGSEGGVRRRCSCSVLIMDLRDDRDNANSNMLINTSRSMKRHDTARNNDALCSIESRGRGRRVHPWPTRERAPATQQQRRRSSVSDCDSNEFQTTSHSHTAAPRHAAHSTATSAVAAPALLFAVSTTRRRAHLSTCGRVSRARA